MAVHSARKLSRRCRTTPCHDAFTVARHAAPTYSRSTFPSPSCPLASVAVLTSTGPRKKNLLVTEASTPQINGVVRTIQMTMRELVAAIRN